MTNNNVYGTHFSVEELKAFKSLITKDAEGGKTRCDLCNTLYTHDGKAIRDHIRKDHSEALRSVILNNEREDHEQAIEYAIQRIDHAIERGLEAYKESLAEYLDHIKKYGVIETARWRLGGFVKVEQAMRDATQIDPFWKECKAEKDWVKFYNGISDKISRRKDRLLTSPHTSSSSCGVTNFVEETNYAAKCQSLRDFGILSNIFYNIDSLTDAVDEIKKLDGEDNDA